MRLRYSEGRNRPGGFKPELWIKKPLLEPLRPNPLMAKAAYMYECGVGLSERVRVRIEVDRIVITDEPIVPTRLDVRDLESVTDRLDV